MEPAGEAGNTPTDTGFGEPQGFLPQWSPSLNGGNTNGTDCQFGQGMLPQWSPPLTGGSTIRSAAPP
jgi:hypothetical protein